MIMFQRHMKPLDPLVDTTGSAWYNKQQQEKSLTGRWGSNQGNTTER